MTTVARDAFELLHQKGPEASTSVGRFDFHVDVAVPAIVMKEQTTRCDDLPVMLDAPVADRFKRVPENEGPLIPADFSKDRTWRGQGRTDFVREEDRVRRYVGRKCLQHRHQQWIIALRLYCRGTRLNEQRTKKRWSERAPLRQQVKLLDGIPFLERAVPDHDVIHIQTMRLEEAALVMGVMHDLAVELPTIRLPHCRDGRERRRLQRYTGAQRIMPRLSGGSQMASGACAS
jgi:hypothetical protein